MVVPISAQLLKHMPSKSNIHSPLDGRTVALPESRQLDLLADMFEKRGASVIRMPLVTILDSPNKALIEKWIRKFIANEPDYFVVLTGEGIRRLVRFASGTGCRDEFVDSLSRVVKICRGPKPGRALKEIGLKADLNGKSPTSAGIIETLNGLPLESKQVAVQLYGEDPNRLIMDYLASRQVEVSTVAPYVYAEETDTQKVLQLISQLVSAEVDIIAFTSKAQFVRLLSVAKANGQEAQLLAGLKQTLVAAVGPVVADQLQENDIKVDVCPKDLFFMKPMLREIEKHLSKGTVQDF